MERTWLDNAFWNDSEQTSLTAIAETTNEDGSVTRQVLTLSKTANGTENPDFIEAVNSITVDKINQNTQERISRKQQEIAEEQSRREEFARAKSLEQLFEAKLKAFEIEEVKNSTNRILKSKLRKAKNQVEVNAYTAIIIMEQLNATEGDSAE